MHCFSATVVYTTSHNFELIFQYGHGGNNPGGIGMYGVGGAASRPMAWSGGGSTKPPMVNNYLDSHGLNAGLGNSGSTTFPSVVDTKPMQVSFFTKTMFSRKIHLFFEIDYFWWQIGGFFGTLWSNQLAKRYDNSGFDWWSDFFI